MLVEIKWKTKKWGSVMTKHTFSFSYCLMCTQGNRDLVFFSCCILRFLVERGNKLPCVWLSLHQKQLVNRTVLIECNIKSPTVRPNPATGLNNVSGRNPRLQYLLLTKCSFVYSSQTLTLPFYAGQVLWQRVFRGYCCCLVPKKNI